MAKIIAIDGPASVGKSTLAKIISRRFDSPILFSGKLYRAVALETIKKRIGPKNIKEILKCVDIIDFDKLNSNELFSSEVDKISSIISANKKLRNRLTKFQRDFPKINDIGNRKFAIIEGRDIGTIVFPRAEYKIFLWANAKIRANRRCEQMRNNGKKVSYNEVFNEINSRDRKDLMRKIAPLMPAANSVLLDTSYIDIEQAFNAVKKTILKTNTL